MIHHACLMEKPLILSRSVGPSNNMMHKHSYSGYAMYIPSLREREV